MSTGLCPSYIVVPTSSAGGEAAQNRTEQDNPFPHLAGSAGPDVLQGTVGPLGSQGTLLSPVEPH